MPENKSNNKAEKKTGRKLKAKGPVANGKGSVTGKSNRNATETGKLKNAKKDESGKSISKKKAGKASQEKNKLSKQTNSRSRTSGITKKDTQKKNGTTGKSASVSAISKTKNAKASGIKPSAKVSKQQIDNEVLNALTKSVAERSSSSKSKKVPVKKSRVKEAATKKISDITGTIKRPPSRVFGKEGRKYEEYIEPMLASLEDQPFDNSEWIFEMKWDGYRAIAEWNKKKLKLYSRNGLSFVQKYPPVAEAVTQLKHDCVLDGEIVVLNEKGRPRFQMLQEYEQDPRHPIHYYVFDLLFLDGNDIRELPLLQRKELLQQFLKSYKGDVIRYSDHVTGSGKKFFHHVKKLDFEGMMAKKADSEYYSGIRTREWLKIKHHNSQEAVIVGFTAPRRSRKYFGALILGEFRGRRLQYIGHTGTGFTHDKLKDLWNLMQPLITTSSPFAEKIKVNAPVTWIRPEIVCEVKFTEQTNEGILRHPVFLGLREDKAAQEVTQNNDR